MNKKIILVLGLAICFWGCSKHSTQSSSQSTTSNGQDGRGGFDYYYTVVPKFEQKIANLSEEILNLPNGELEYLAYKYSQSKKPISKERLSQIIANTKLSPTKTAQRKNAEGVIYPLVMDYHKESGTIEALQPFFENFKNDLSISQNYQIIQGQEIDEFQRSLIHEALHIIGYDGYKEDHLVYLLSSDIAYALINAKKGCGFTGDLEDRMLHCHFRFPHVATPLVTYDAINGRVDFKVNNLIVRIHAPCQTESYGPDLIWRKANASEVTEVFDGLTGTPWVTRGLLRLNSNLCVASVPSGFSESALALIK